MYVWMRWIIIVFLLNDDFFLSCSSVQYLSVFFMNGSAFLKSSSFRCEAIADVHLWPRLCAVTHDVVFQ